MTTATTISRRGALSALAAFTAAPSISLPAIADNAADVSLEPKTNVDLLARFLWIERQSAIERLFRVQAEYDKASEKLPAWAKSGFDRIDQNGNPCGKEMGWPLDTSIKPPLFGHRLVRVPLWQCRDDFYFAVNTFALGPKGRAKARATMRARMRRVITLLRERNRLYVELGLIELDRQLNDICNAITSAEDSISELEPTPNAVAAQLMATLGDECDRASRATGNGYCGTMAMALVVLRGLLPKLSGLIKTHAAFFVSNPDLPLSEMPFVAC
jgi:hypothetical protein